jgi:hypothetical protein
MSRRPRIATERPAAEKTVKPELSRVEWIALQRIAETGLAVTQALHLIPNTTTAEAALRKLQAAI